MNKNLDAASSANSSEVNVIIHAFVVLLVICYLMGDTIKPSNTPDKKPNKQPKLKNKNI